MATVSTSSTTPDLAHYPPSRSSSSSNLSGSTRSERQRRSWRTAPPGQRGGGNGGLRPALSAASIPVRSAAGATHRRTAAPGQLTARLAHSAIGSRACPHRRCRAARVAPPGHPGSENGGAASNAAAIVDSTAAPARPAASATRRSAAPGRSRLGRVARASRRRATAAAWTAPAPQLHRSLRCQQRRSWRVPPPQQRTPNWCVPDAVCAPRPRPTAPAGKPCRAVANPRQHRRSRRVPPPAQRVELRCLATDVLRGAKTTLPCRARRPAQTADSLAGVASSVDHVTLRRQPEREDAPLTWRKTKKIRGGHDPGNEIRR